MNVSHRTCETLLLGSCTGMREISELTIPNEKLEWQSKIAVKGDQVSEVEFCESRKLRNTIPA